MAFYDKLIVNVSKVIEVKPILQSYLSEVIFVPIEVEEERHAS